MTNKAFATFLFLVSCFLAGCQFNTNSGRLVLVNGSGKPFYYTLEVPGDKPNRTYFFHPDSTEFSLLNVAESDTINISGQYDEDDEVNLYIFVEDSSLNIAGRVRAESIGIRFLNATGWAPVVIENL